jgi:hypothetical protein
MSYTQALEAAGATVHAAEYFGSYQGDAMADVTYEGRRGILAFGFGSCSGCDDFEATFGYDDGETCDEHRWEADADCGRCVIAAFDFANKLADYGRDMLNGVMYGDVELARYREQLVEQTRWDGDAQAQLRWYDEHCVPVIISAFTN